MEFSEEERYSECETDAEYSDDSEEDPTFDVLEETRLTLSKLNIKRKIKPQTVNGENKKEEQGPDAVEMVIPELNEQDQKSYETIWKIIEGGQVEKLKVEQCKIYLRKHGLRLSGKKEELILRIKEHIDVLNYGGEKKYPAHSFVLNCKGDACMGDIVMFEQNVYEVFSIASRSATGPPIGTRVVAGRIVKESYGAAKQQHTFTIEVLWSKGEKPLPPLYPLLIKGRNLYRLKTMRQKWNDEGERQKILSEKHARGGAARLNREERIQQKENRKMHKATRATRDSVSMKPEKQINHQPNYIPAHVLPKHIHRTQPPINVNCSFQSSQFVHFDHPRTPLQPSFMGPVHGFGQSHIPREFNMNQSHLIYTQQTRGRDPNVERKQTCRYYVQGKCYYGDRCKYSHEIAGNNR